MQELGNLNIHYIHQKPKGSTAGKTVVPLLLLHGWPGSVREFYDFIPMLTTPNSNADVVFEVIAPSLVGYGWSDPARRPGFGTVQQAIVMRNLMLKLGFRKFFVQGGDWGSIIGSNVVTFFPENVIGYHSNMCFAMTPLAMFKLAIGSFAKSWVIEKQYEDFVYPLSEKFETVMIEMGYFHLQATKPDTIGAALVNNPIGLAAYILEKFSTWTALSYRDRDDGGFDGGAFTTDALLDNIMIYYLTNSITSSMRLYSEAFSKREQGLELERIPVHVPTACARFRNDLGHSLDWQLIDKYQNLIQSTYHMFGGHFIAMERPGDLYKDFMSFVGKVRK